MTIQMILLPLFVQVMLTFALGIGMGYQRKIAFDNGLRVESIALGQPNWPPRAMQWANAYRNQFELPVLFYVLTILSIMTRHADLIFLVLAWIFVVTRLIHAYVFVSNNNVKLRGAWFGLGAITLLIAWIIFIVRILAGLP